MPLLVHKLDKQFCHYISGTGFTSWTGIISKHVVKMVPVCVKSTADFHTCLEKKDFVSTLLIFKCLWSKTIKQLLDLKQKGKTRNKKWPLAFLLNESVLATGKRIGVRLKRAIKIICLKKVAHIFFQWHLSCNAVHMKHLQPTNFARHAGDMIHNFIQNVCPNNHCTTFKLVLWSRLMGSLVAQPFLYRV
jgi:hypothetical protein